MESCLETKQGPTHKWPPLNAYLPSDFRLNAVLDSVALNQTIGFSLNMKINERQRRQLQTRWDGRSQEDARNRLVGEW